MKGLTIKISYGETRKRNKINMLLTAASNELQDSIFVCKNKASGKYFIYLDDLKNHNVRLINPDGGQLDLSADLFEEPKDESIDYLLSYKFITEMQLEKYKHIVSSQPRTSIRKSTTDSGKAKTRRAHHHPRSSMARKSPSPSAYEWSRSVPELSRISGRVTWRAICDYLKVYVRCELRETGTKRLGQN